MKRNILLCGVVAGLINAAWLIGAVAFGDHENFENGQVYGYTAMIISFSLIFVGVKNFRDKHNDGVVTFGKAFLIGLYITLIASTFYVVAWLIDFYVFIPDFMDKYATHVIDKMKASGASADEVSKQAEEMAKFKEWYKNPLFNMMITYCEILPVGMIISLISAAILKRKAVQTA